MRLNGTHYPRYYDLEMQSAYLLTRRCKDRKFRFKPNKFTKQMFIFLLALAAEQYNVEINALAIMSNHYHLVVSATSWDSDISGFMHCLNYSSACVINDHQNSKGPVYEQGKISIKPLSTPKAIIEAIAYVICNPVEAGLVSHPQHWPGLISLAKKLLKFNKSADRPKFYGPKTTKPKELTLKLHKPRALSKESDESYLSDVIKAVDERCKRIRQERRKEGLKFLGAEIVKRQPWHKTPDSPDVTKTQSVYNEDLIFKPSSSQDEENYKAFRKAHRQCIEEVKAGKRPTFPRGTHKMVRIYGFPVVGPG